MKKLLRIAMTMLFCVVLFLCLAPVGFAESGTWGTLDWTLDTNGTLTITGSGAMPDFNDYSFNDAWHPYYDKIKSVTIPASVTSIGSWAFFYCDTLDKITIPEGVRSIGAYAFYDCNGLVSVQIPTSVETIGAGAFWNCTALSKVVIPEGVNSIGSLAFNNCTSLTSIQIPASVTTLDELAFCNCDGILSAGPMNSGCNYEFGWTEVIPENAFNGCGSLTSVVIPASVTEIGRSAFAGSGLV